MCSFHFQRKKGVHLLGLYFGIQSNYLALPQLEEVDKTGLLYYCNILFQYLFFLKKKKIDIVE